VQHITEDGGVMVVPEDAALPDFKDAIRFEPREITKYFEVRNLAAGRIAGWWWHCWWWHRLVLVPVGHAGLKLCRQGMQALASSLCVCNCEHWSK
jgi:hypothetical protein